jgi:hypothetical protein
MYYILDDLGYIEEVSSHYIERDNKTCFEYTGAIPEGYETLDDWVLNANIRAYKLDGKGNLIFDADRDAALQAEWEKKFAPYDYSTNEQIIGRWVDGKPLYRKVKVITPSVYNTDIGGVGESNIDKVVSAKGMAYRPSSGYYNTIPCTYTNWEIYLYDITAHYGRLLFSTNQWNAGVGECILIFEYTKTTD